VALGIHASEIKYFIYMKDGIMREEMFDADGIATDDLVLTKDQFSCHGITTMHVPLGVPECIKSHMKDINNRLLRKMQLLTTLDSPQIALTLLRECAGVKTFTYWTRTMLTDDVIEFCELVDAATIKILETTVI